jgi:stage II sporulation protein D
LAKLARLRANNSAEKRECIYELKSTVDDQVYGGKDSETEPTDRAINETYGIVGTYNGKVINAGYHSTCGGKTNDGGEPYLVSRICHFCELSPQYKWEISSSVADISKGMGKIKNIEICSKTSSGRVKAVKVLGETGNHTISGEELRSRLGLKSCFFDIIVGGDEVKITGRGYGHGIGLCQYGAIGMASKGYDYKSILKFYFKGIRIEKIY